MRRARSPSRLERDHVDLNTVEPIESILLEASVHV
jgi:hypothetical protein